MCRISVWCWLWEQTTRLEFDVRVFWLKRFAWSRALLHVNSKMDGKRQVLHYQPFSHHFHAQLSSHSGLTCVLRNSQQLPSSLISCFVISLISSLSISHMVLTFLCVCFISSVVQTLGPHSALEQRWCGTWKPKANCSTAVFRKWYAHVISLR